MYPEFSVKALKNNKKGLAIIDKPYAVFYSRIHGCLLVLALFWGLAQVRLEAQALDPARHYSEYFTGLSTELSIDTDLVVSADPGFAALDFVYTWGMRKLFPGLPLRVRAGLGFTFWPSGDFVLLAGPELGLFEFLNGHQARQFGVYLLSDGLLRFSEGTAELAWRPGIKLLLGINTLSCLGLGTAWDTKYGWVIRLEYSGGVYFLK